MFEMMTISSTMFEMIGMSTHVKYGNNNEQPGMSGNN